MSSLAGALVPPDAAHHTQDSPMASPKAEDDLDSVPPDFHFHPEPSPEDDKQELNDLFGEDEDVNMVEHEYVGATTHTLSHYP